MSKELEPFPHKLRILKNMMISNKISNVRLFKFKLFSQISFIKHNICSRKGGASKTPFQSLNFSYGVGDNPNLVKKNRLILESLSQCNRSIYLNQVHTAKILVLAKKSTFAKTIIDGKIYRADAVITDIPEINLVIQTADCQAVLIIDPVKKVIANIHNGWRGSIGHIIEKTVSKMVYHFQCTPNNMFAAIGPSLGPCCAEFSNYKEQFPKNFHKYKIANSNFNFDFWEITKNQLYKTGLQHSSVYCSNICTKCHSNMFFSYRKNKITGRFATAIKIEYV